MKFYFISTFLKITVGGFVNQLIKKIWPYTAFFARHYEALLNL